MADSRPQPSPLARAAASGVKWTSLSAATIFALGLLQISILAHLLSPRDFGLMAAVVVVIGLAQAFSDMGVSMAVVVRRDVTRQALSSLYWANVLAGCAVFLVLVGCSPLAAAYFDAPQVATLMPIAASAFLIGPIGQQFQALLQRELAFDVIAKIEVAGMVGAVCSTVTFAALGADALALVLGLLTNTATKAGLFAWRGSRAWGWPSLRLRRDDLRDYIGFGAYQMGERLLTFLGSNLDYLLVGHFLGSHALGIYAFAYQLIIKPVITINPILTRVAMPVFAQRQLDGAAMSRGFTEVTRLLGHVMLPLLTGIAIAAPDFVPLFFGSGWHETVGLIQILAIVAALRALGNAIGSVLIAKNRPDIGFKANLVMAPALGLAIWSVVGLGVTAVAWAYLTVLASSLVAFLMIVQRVVGLPWHSWLATLAAPAGMTLVVGGVMLGLSSTAPGSPGDHAARLALLAVGGLLTYAILLVRYRRGYVTWLWTTFTSSTARRRPTGPPPQVRPAHTGSPQ